MTDQYPCHPLLPLRSHRVESLGYLGQSLHIIDAALGHNAIVEGQRGDAALGFAHFEAGGRLVDDVEALESL